MDTVLDFANFDSGKTEVVETGTDLGGLLNGAADRFRGAAAPKGLDLRLEQTSSLPRFVITDPAKLGRALENLMDNAVKYTSKGGVTVRAGVAAPADKEGKLMIRLDVEDTREGIAPADIEAVFRPFEQLGKCGLSQGPGLGLSVARGYAGLLGGGLTVRSQPGKGSVFSLTARCGLVAAADVPALCEPDNEIVSVQNAPYYRVLVAEDQPDSRLLVVGLLSAYGFQIKEAANGSEAVAAAKEWRPDLVLMDRSMPVLDGLSAARELRVDPGTSGIPVIALTAHCSPDERREMLEAGCVDLLPKPFRGRDLLEMIARRLTVRLVRAGPAAEQAVPPPLDD